MSQSVFEIALTNRGGATYLARFRYETEGAAPITPEGTVTLDTTTLNRCSVDPDAYGRTLAANLFPDGPLRATWDNARPTGDSPLCVNLQLPEADLALRLVRWESLRDPLRNTPLTTDQGYWFSRQLPTADGRPARVRAKSALRALVVVASPTDLANLRVGQRAFSANDQFEVADEVAAARESLKGVTSALTVLPSAEGRATLGNIAAQLRRGFDLVYLIAHGALVDGVPKLLLEDDAGSGVEVDGRKLTDEITQLWHRPALMVLSSCQSAGPVRPARVLPADDDLDTTLGAELGRAGVGAVVSMLGNVYQETARTFSGKLFEALAQDGRIDRAVGEARFAVRGQPDNWAPILATRAPDTRLWQGGGPRTRLGFDGWPALIKQLQNQQCVPVLGAGMLDRLTGSTRELAQEWACMDEVPTTGTEKWDIPQVAQYLTITNSPAHVLSRYLEVMTAAMDRTCPGESMPPLDLDADPKDVLRDHASHLLNRLNAAATADRLKYPPEGHALLAKLPCRLYITTNADSILPTALVTAGRKPTVQQCNWLTPADNPPGPSPDSSTTPTDAAPLVYQLFGHLSNPESVVLTEDDYFKFLVGMSHDSVRPKPSFVQRILTRSALLFLGFRIEDWDFRVFLRFLMSRQAARNRQEQKMFDVAVQVDPIQEGAPDADKIRRYLDKLFGRSEVNINIYWGSTSDFLEELYDRWPA